MKIFDIIFGKIKTIVHPVLGELTSSRIKGNDQNKICSWYGIAILDKKHEATEIIMEGNNSSPFPIHLNFVSQLVENWESTYFLEIEKKLVEKGINNIKKFTNWQNDFYVGAITPLDDRKAEFEIVFEPLISDNTNYIAIEFRNSIITKVELS